MEHDLFDRVGFKFEYRKEMERFYRPFFSSNEELEQFFVEVFQLENKDLRPRQMINQICRFVTLANDIEQIRPGRDPLRILFLRICIESLCSLGQDWKRKSDLYKQFPMCISDEGAEYIITLDTILQTRKMGFLWACVGKPLYLSTSLHLTIFLKLSGVSVI